MYLLCQNRISHHPGIPWFCVTIVYIDLRYIYSASKRLSPIHLFLKKNQQISHRVSVFLRKSALNQIILRFASPMTAADLDMKVIPSILYEEHSKCCLLWKKYAFYIPRIFGNITWLECSLRRLVLRDEMTQSRFSEFYRNR